MSLLYPPRKKNQNQYNELNNTTKRLYIDPRRSGNHVEKDFPIRSNQITFLCNQLRVPLRSIQFQVSGIKLGVYRYFTALSVSNFTNQNVSQISIHISPFFDISKAFDRVWHKDPLFKLRPNGIEGNLLTWLTST